MKPQRAAIGFSVHTGWAVSVLVAGPPRTPSVLDRRRIRLSESDVTEEAQVYHQAAELSEAAAMLLVQGARKAAAKRALSALRSLVDSYPLSAAGVLMGTVEVPADLRKILASHPLIHTAEGAFYREALAGAAEVCGLALARIPRRELVARFASALGANEKEASDWLAAIGKSIGPPWGKDQKDAAMTAVVALSKG